MFQPSTLTAVVPHRTLRVGEWLRIFGIFVVLSSGILSGPSQAEVPGSFCRAEGKRSSALLDSRIPAGFAADVDTVWKLVRKLHHELDIPLSFIENEADEPIALPAAAQTLEEVLRAIADRHESYRCEAYADRLVLRSSDPIFDVMISGVDVVEEYLFPARDAYIDHLRASDQRFKNWHSLWAMAGDSPVTTNIRPPGLTHPLNCSVTSGIDPVTRTTSCACSGCQPFITSP
jgi:hypothetical protein